MIPLHLLLATCLLAPPPVLQPAMLMAPRPLVLEALQGKKQQQEYKKKREAAEGNAEALWELAQWCKEQGMEAEGRECLEAAVAVDAAHEQAHRALGHIELEGKWFESQAEADEYRRANGWVQQDLQWIPPQDAEKVKQRLWLCDGRWLGLKEANEFHSQLFQWWEIPTDHFILRSTQNRNEAEETAKLLELAYADLRRICGIAPEERMIVTVLRNRDQYQVLAAGDQLQGIPPVEATGFSSVHGSFFADFWFDRETREFEGCGVAYNEAGDAFGPLFARHAAGQSYLDAIDPSPEFIAAVQKGAREIDPRDFWKEKDIPLWFRYGAAAYVERFFLDRFDPDPTRWRSWSVQNILRQGGLEDWKKIFAFEISSDDPEGSGKLIKQAGLLIAFLLDGDNKDLKKAHAEVKEALKSGSGHEKAFRALEQAFEKSEKELRMFANL